MKTKTIDIDGQSYTIGQLNVGQVRKYVALDDPGSADGWIRGYDVICCGLNNAQPKQGPAGTDPEQQTWTHERIEEELPWPAYHALQKEILALSGFAPVEGNATGEAAGPLSPTIN